MMGRHNIIEIIDSLLNRVDDCINFSKETNNNNHSEHTHGYIATRILSHDEMFQLDDLVRNLCKVVRGDEPRETEWVGHWGQLEKYRERKGNYPTSSLEGWMNTKVHLRMTRAFVISLLSEQREQNTKERKKSAMARDIYNIGQAGAVGPKSYSSNTNMYASSLSGINFVDLAEELETLRHRLRSEAESADQDLIVADIARAEKAAKENDAESVEAYLKNAGRWALSVSEKIGVGVATAAIKTAMGL